MAGAGNVISGNSGEVGSGIFGDGVFLTNTLDNFVLGNRIGVDVSGLIAVPNAGDGVYLYEAYDNYIGDPAPAISFPATAKAASLCRISRPMGISFGATL